MHTKLMSVAVFATYIALASPVAARDFKYQFICDLDGAAPFTDREGGHATLDPESGDLEVNISKLRPSTTYTCVVSCQFNKAAAAPCATDNKGKLDVEIRGLGRSGSLATGCGYPNVTVFAGNQFCQNGYGQP